MSYSEDLIEIKNCLAWWWSDTNIPPDILDGLKDNSITIQQIVEFWNIQFPNNTNIPPAFPLAAVENIKTRGFNYNWMPNARP